MKVTLVFVVYFILVSSMFCVYLQLRQIKKKQGNILEQFEVLWVQMSDTWIYLLLLPH